MDSNIRTTKKILQDRVKAREAAEQEKIDPELKKMHEIFGNPNSSTAPINPAQTEIQAKRFHEAIFGKRKSRVEY